jgi:glutamine synthetase
MLSVVRAGSHHLLSTLISSPVHVLEHPSHRSIMDSCTTAQHNMRQKYRSLELPANTAQVTYVWNDGSVAATKSKSRTFDFVPQKAEDLPIWNFGALVRTTDGKAQAADHYLKPVALFRDPFWGGNSKLAWCETVMIDGSPTSYNTRASCLQVMERVEKQHDPWFGIEQEYCLMQPALDYGTGKAPGRPLGWHATTDPAVLRFDYLCAVGADVVVGRDVHEAAYRACLYAGIRMFGENSESMPCQWEYQVGPLPGIQCADHLWMSRHILRRVAEDFGVSVSQDPKILDDWQSSGAHTNLSTSQTRDPASGMDAIQDAIRKLSLKHKQHMRVYDMNHGKDNERRLKSAVVTSSSDSFSSGIANRAASIRIPQHVAANGCGYIEDRRPASNCDPYLVMEAIIRTVCLKE